MLFLTINSKALFMNENNLTNFKVDAEKSILVSPEGNQQESVLVKSQKRNERNFRKESLKNTKNFEIKSTYSLKNLIDFVKYPVITEKTFRVPLGSTNTQYTFDVDKRLTKPQIKVLFEKIFNINVIAVNTHIPPRKTVRVGVKKGYRPSFKRAIITLQAGQTVNFNLV